MSPSQPPSIRNGQTAGCLTAAAVAAALAWQVLAQLLVQWPS